jgi:Fic family protein
MNCFEIGRYVEQPSGYKAFIPAPFPPVSDIKLPKNIAVSHTEAVRLLGKLDGITELLPDKDRFLRMFIQKDASNSSQIEGTRATMMDVIEKQNVEP